jgi:hypothetical protein
MEKHENLGQPCAPAAQVNPSESPISAVLGVNKAAMMYFVNVMQGFRFRDKMYQRFGLNRWEVWMLVSLAGYLSSLGRQIIGKTDFFEHLSNNYRIKAKFPGYFAGLQKHKCIGTFEYISKPGSESVGLSDYGVTIVEAYFEEMERLFAIYGVSGRFILPASTSQTHSHRYRRSA